MKKSLYFILCFAFFNVLHATDEEVIVTSSLGGATLAEIDSPVFVIKGDDINYSASTNLGESLTYLLGVNSSNFGPGVGQPIIRGMGGTRVRILSNGKLVRDVSGLGSDHLNDVDMNDLQQIEVVRGPSSLLYSNGTMGGIINIVDQTIASKDFEGSDFNIGLERQTANMGTAGSFSYKGNVDGLNLTYALKEVNFESHEVPSGAIIHEGSPIAFHGEEEEEEGHGEEEHEERIQADTESENVTIEGAVTNLRGLDKLSYFFQANDYSFTEGHVEGEHHEGEEEEEEEEEHGPTTFTNESFEFGMKMDIGNQAGGNRQNVTINMSQEDVAIIGEEAFMKPVDSQMLSFGYFICRELDVVDLDFGVRLDQTNRDGAIGNTLHDISESDLSTALTMGWDLANNVGLTLGISSVARAPSEIELFMNGTHLAAARVEIGNVNLESERSNNIDFSVNYENDGYFVNASVYSNAVDNYIYLLDSGTKNAKNLPITNYRQADADFNGYEVEVGRSFTTNNGEVQISYGRDEVVGTFGSGGNVPRITPIKNVYRFALENENVTYDVKIIDVQKEDDIGFGESVTDGYTMGGFDIRRSIAIGSDEELVLSVFGRNLMDEKARNHTSYVKNEVPLAGRNFGIKLNFNF